MSPPRGHTDASVAPPRDAQRSRVYRAETPLRGRRLPDLARCGAFVDTVVGSLWWADRFPELDLGRVPRLRPGQGARHAFYREDTDGPTITIPRRYRTTTVVLHELAHWAMRDVHDLPAHGRTFARLLLDLVTEFGGDRPAEQLAASFCSEGVHVAPPPRRGPSGRWCYEWDERLRLGRGRELGIRLTNGELVRGVLTARSRGSLRLDTGREAVRVPEREVGGVDPLAIPAAPATTAARR